MIQGNFWEPFRVFILDILSIEIEIENRHRICKNLSDRAAWIKIKVAIKWAITAPNTFRWSQLDILFDKSVSNDWIVQYPGQKFTLLSVRIFTVQKFVNATQIPQKTE